MNERRVPSTSGAEPVRPHAPDYLLIEMQVTRAELQILVLAVTEFLRNPTGAGAPLSASPEWFASEFHAIVGRDISVGEALLDRLREMKCDVDAPFAQEGGNA